MALIFGQGIHIEREVNHQDLAFAVLAACLRLLIEDVAQRARKSRDMQLLDSYLDA